MSRVIKGKSKDVFSIMEHSFDQGKTVWIVVTGMSMYPFLREDRDMVEVIRVSLSGIKRGDIVLIQRHDGEFVLHRVITKDPSSFYVIGDAQQWLEGPIVESQLKATVINIKRNYRMISCNNRFLKALVELWLILRPVRYMLIRVIRFASQVIAITK